MIPKAGGVDDNGESACQNKHHLFPSHHLRLNRHDHQMVLHPPVASRGHGSWVIGHSQTVVLLATSRAAVECSHPG